MVQFETKIAESSSHEADPCLGQAALRESFRDPSGRLFALNGRILRIVNADGEPDLRAFFRSAQTLRLAGSKAVVQSRVLDGEELAQIRESAAVNRLYNDIQGSLIVEHERIPFASFPYEWPPEMLHAAGLLTVELAIELLSAGLGLKDATPYNVLFHGPEPVFVDMLSFERREPADPTWLPYAQFVRTFLLPLLAYRHFGLTLDRTFGACHDGLEPETIFRWLNLLQKIRPPFLSLVSMPVWLGGKTSTSPRLYESRTVGDPEKARFILFSLFSRLRRLLNRLEPSGRGSLWAEYMRRQTHYSQEGFGAKERAVQDMLAQFAPKRVLDVGANTGHFSIFAAQSGADVVAVDSDPVVVGEVWRTARSSGLSILPLVVNVAQPSPPTGWHNTERPSFLERACGNFDAVFMLAVIHHMLVTERIPLDRIIGLAAELTTKLALIEFIPPTDPMFRIIARGRDALHRDLTQERFEAAVSIRFEIVRSVSVEGSGRRIYTLCKR